MRYRLAVVGRLRRGFYRDGCDFYLKRLRAFGKVELSEVKEGRGGDQEQVRANEADSLLAAADGRLITLDEHGKAFGSRDLAARLDRFELDGEASITLFIGGAEGLHERVKAAAQESWSLSSLTLPHELARLVLLEQLYRAETIRNGHPYHRE